MKCPNCGFENDGKFCVNCGTPLNAQQAEQTAEEQTTVPQDANAPEQNFEQSQTNQTDSQDFAQHYGNQPQGGGAQGANQTSYGQQFTNQKTDYTGQQFTNAPNGAGQPKKSGGKTAIIIVSIIGGLVLILAIIFGVAACNVISGVSKNIPSIVSEIADIAESSDYLDDDSYYEDSDDSSESDYFAESKEFYDEASRFNYAESEEYDGWKIVGYEMDFDITSSRINIEVPSQIEGRDVVEIETIHAYYDDNYVTVTIPGTVKVIRSYSMSFVDDYDEIIIEDGVETIEENAFLGDEDLKKVHVPASVTMMDGSGIGFEVDDDYNPVAMDDFVLYGKKGSTAEKYAKENKLKFVAE